MQKNALKYRSTFGQVFHPYLLSTPTLNIIISIIFHSMLLWYFFSNDASYEKYLQVPSSQLAFNSSKCQLLKLTLMLFASDHLCTNFVSWIIEI
jgi:hypothetical protein